MEAKITPSQIRFRAQCATKFGEILGVSGSIPQLGNWDPKGALKMKWDDNNWWQVDIPNPHTSFEYKYVLLHDHDPFRACFEPGMNRIFNSSQQRDTDTVIIVDVWGKRESFIARDHYKQEIRIMTFNIRFDNPNDGKFVWKNRAEKVASIIRIYRPDIVGIQEALINQIKDLEKSIGEQYKWVGWGRDDGKTAGEFCPILYRADLFTLKECGVFWLSETPEIPGSKSWDSSLPRLCTWAKFHRKATEYLQKGKEFFVFNTHLDHQSLKARNEGLKLIVSKIASLAADIPSFLMGDFNTVSGSSELIDIIEKPNPWGIF